MRSLTAITGPPHTTHIGAALGKPAEAEELVAELDAAFADVRAKNPALAGKTSICAEVYDGAFDVLGASAPRTAFLTSVGLTLDPTLVELASKGDNAPLSSEKVDLLDGVDVGVWTTDLGTEDKLFASPLVKALKNTREGRDVAADNGGDDDLV